ncbi:MAG: hypothetical protein BWX50_00438 [Euryarchaeota archaeon ADurb.Bin009]|nr:MAG: hypothetical protein BWX50_00438 [Euryarchaeota archaeon ADurb.Bin009]
MDGAGGYPIAVQVRSLHDYVAVLHAVLNDLARRTDQSTVLAGHHVADVPDDGKLRKVGVCRIDRPRHHVGDARGAHPGDAEVKAVHLGIGRAAGLADVVVDDQDAIRREAVLLKKGLLAGPEVGEDLQGVVIRDVAHRHRLELADEDGSGGYTFTGERLRKYRLRADAVGVDVGDDRHRVGFRDPIYCPLHVTFEAHLHSSAPRVSINHGVSNRFPGESHAKGI